jgi:hypothetical protein
MKAALSFQGDTWCPSLMYPGSCLSTSPTDHRVVSQGVMMQVALENGKVAWTDTGFRMDFEK